MKINNDIENFDKELEGFSKLKSLDKKNTFTVPDNYFDQLESEIMNQVKATGGSSKSIRMNTRRLLYYAAAASIVALFVFAALQYNKPGSDQPQIVKQPINKTIPAKNIAQTQENNAPEERDAQDLNKVESLQENAIALDNEDVLKNIDGTHQNKLDNPSPEIKNEQNHSKEIDIANNDQLPNQGGNSNLNGGQISNGSQNKSTNNNTDYAIARAAVNKYLDLGDDICSSKSVTLDATIKATRNINYVWSNDATNPIIEINKSGTYWVTLMDHTNRVLGSDTIVVNIIAKPAPNLGDDRTICNYESALISSGCKNTDFQYQWSVCEATTAEVYLTNLEPGLHKIALTVTSCADTVLSEMLLTVEDCNLVVPNVITPNGDGRNDRFVIQGLEHYSRSQLYILDRNGKIIYESLDYNNDWEAVNIPAGTYFYRLQLNDGKNTEKNGTLTIIR